MTTVWIIVAIFVVIALIAGGVQVVSALGDKKIGDERAADRSRLHTHPDDPENPSTPQGRS